MAHSVPEMFKLEFTLKPASGAGQAQTGRVVPPSETLQQVGALDEHAASEAPVATTRMKSARKGPVLVRLLGLGPQLHVRIDHLFERACQEQSRIGD
jgi:hypothetical protein